MDAPARIGQVAGLVIYRRQALVVGLHFLLHFLALYIHGNFYQLQQYQTSLEPYIAIYTVLRRANLESYDGAAPYLAAAIALNSFITCTVISSEER